MNQHDVEVNRRRRDDADSAIASLRTRVGKLSVDVGCIENYEARKNVIHLLDAVDANLRVAQSLIRSMVWTDADSGVS
jgi:hypothetical protein